MTVTACLCLQTPDELELCQWDISTSSYLSVDAAGQALEVLNQDSLAACRLISTLPAVHCLPKGAADALATSTVCHLSLELQLPSNCQLHGWQPPGAASPAGSEGSSSQDGSEMQVVILARPMGGGYLPVSVEQVKRGTANATEAHVTAQVRQQSQCILIPQGKANHALSLQ